MEEIRSVLKKDHGKSSRENIVWARTKDRLKTEKCAPTCIMNYCSDVTKWG